MTAFLADSVRGLVQSDIRAMTRECVRVGGLNLGQGVCRLPVEREILDAAVEAIAGDNHSYTLAEGIEPLRLAIAAKVAEHNGLTADPQSEVVVTAGTTAAYTSALVALLNRGDGILFIEPYYGYHVGVAAILGYAPAFVSLDPPEFEITQASLEAALTPRTRALVVCTPANPNGRMLSLPEIEAVADVARRHNLLVITDEIYEFIRFDGRPHISPASVSDLWSRTVSIMGLSKTYSVTGWRLGYAVAPVELARPLSLTHDLCYICAPAPLQRAAVVALNLPREYYTRVGEAYQKRRDRLCRALDAAGLHPLWPQGSYFVLADIDGLGFDSAKEAAMALLHRHGIASVPGTEFFRGSVGNRFLRFCFAVDETILTAACDRLNAMQFARTDT